MAIADEQRLLRHVLEVADTNDPESVIRAVDGYSEGRSGLMHVGRDKGEILDKAVLQSGAGRILELGTYFGYSALRMARCLEENGRIVTIDADEDRVEIAARLLAFAGLGDKVETIRGGASEVIPTLEGPFDLVLIDHYPQNYLPDLQAIEEHGLLRAGSTIVTDNVVVFEDRLKPYLEYLRDSGKFESTLHKPAPRAGKQPTDGMEISIRRG